MPSGETPLAVARHDIGRHGDDGQVRRRPLPGVREQMGCNSGVVPAWRPRFAPAYLPGGGKAIHLRHLAVHEHGGIGQTPYRVESLVAVGGDLDLVAHFVEQAHHHPLIDGVIFDHQNTRAAAGLGGSVSSDRNECRRWRSWLPQVLGGRRGCSVSTDNGR